MTTFSRAQLSFASGEVSPLLHRRPDYQRAQTGLALCNGFLPLRQGGITRAPGTVFDGYTRNNAAGRLVDFEFAEDDALTLEFTPGKLRFWRYGAPILSDGSPYEIDTPYGADSLPALQWQQSADVIYLVDGLNPMQRLSRYALDHWTIAPVNHTTGPFRVQNLDEDLAVQASATTGSVTLTASAALFEADHVGSLFQLARSSSPDIPLWTADVAAISGDRMIYDGNCYRIVAFDGTSARTDSTEPTWTGTAPATLDDGEIEWSQAPAASYPARTSSTVYALGDHRNFGGLSWVVTGVDITNARSVGVNPPQHSEGDVLTEKGGPVWRYEDDGTGVVRITAVASATSASGIVLRTLPQGTVATPSYRWSEGAWSDRHGWPACLAAHDQRLIAAATPTDPRTFWASVVGDYEDFTPGIEADDAFAFAVAGQASLNRITWMASGGTGLHIGALGEEFSTRSSSADTVIGPTTTVIGTDGTIGSLGIRPIVPDGAPIFIAKDGGRLFQIAYSFETDRKRATELSLPADHIGARGFAEIVWQRAPQRMAWLRLDDGTLAGMVYDAAEEVLGWARLSVAGGFVESLSVSPAADAKADILTMIVRRQIGGQPRRMIERQSVTFGLTPAAAAPAANHAFAAAVFALEEPTDTFHLPHLAGEEVHAWTDLGPAGPLTVAADGTVTLPFAVAQAVIGLFDATHMAQTLDIQPVAPDGDAMGRRKRLPGRIPVAVYRTAQALVCTVESDFAAPPRIGRPARLVPLRVGQDATALQSGYATAELVTGSATETALRFLPEGLAPMTVLAVVPAVSEHGR